MFIKDVQKFINQFKMITEAVTLPNIRQGILGKKGMKEYPVIESDKEWYDEHKNEVLKTIEKALNVEDKTLKIKLQKFDTEDFFTNDKPRKLKVRELIKTLRKKFISEVERSRMTEEKTSGIEAQYEMMEMKNGVEVYAVYTPMANRYLAHTKLWSKNCFSPTWCIASSTANNYWNHYHLYEADFPSVFIVAQKTKTEYNPVKYELKCNPHKSVSFKYDGISLRKWVDEWRNPEQNDEENSFEGTSLFDTFKITPEDLENTIRKLLNSKKVKGFSKKFGREMIAIYTEKIKSGDEDTKLEYLTKACKNGTFINFIKEIDKEDKEYFLDELIRYGTLTEAEVMSMDLKNNKNALLNLIKNKRCTHLSLEWAKNHFDGNMVRKVYHSLPDEILLMEENDDENMRNRFFELLEDVEGLASEYANYLIKKDKFDKDDLYHIANDKETLSKCVDYLIKKDDFSTYYLELVKDDKELLTKCVDYLIEKDKLAYYALSDIKDITDNKELLTKCVDYLIKKGKVDIETLLCVKDNKELLIKCIKYLIQISEFDETLDYINDDRDLFSKCLDYLIKINKVDNYTLKYLKNDRETFLKCVDSMIKNGKVNNYTLSYVEDDRDSFLKCVDYLIKNNKVNDNTLDYVEDNKELLSKCVDSIIKNGKVENYILKYVKNDKELLSKCIYSMIENGKVNNDTLSYVEDDKELLSKCIYYIIKNGEVKSYTLSCVKHNKELLSKCIYSMIENDKVDDYILKYVEDNKELLSKCVESMIENGKVDDYILKYVKDNKELLSKCIYSMIENGKVNYYTLSYLKNYEDLYLKCKNYLENK